MDIQQRKFQTISHCVDLDNDSGKKVLVSVSICHINKCDGCDPSGEKGLHKSSCAWNILTKESCQLHEVNSKGCPVHDTIFRTDYGEQKPEGKQDNETSPDVIITCTDDEAKNVGMAGNNGHRNEAQETSQGISTPLADNWQKSNDNQDKDDEKEDEEKEKTSSPEPPKDDGGSGGGGVFIPPAGLLIPEMPLEEASNIPSNVDAILRQNLISHKYNSTDTGTSISFNEIQKQNGNTTCSYVYIDKLGENLSTRLPNIITEALASSALQLNDDLSIPDCLYSPYQKITALTLEKIQQLKNKIYNSSDISAHTSTDIYKIKDGEAIYVVGNETENSTKINDEGEDHTMFRLENMITIENPNVEYSEGNNGIMSDQPNTIINICPTCQMKEKELYENANLEKENVYSMRSMCHSQYNNSSLAYECCYPSEPNPYVERNTTDCKMKCEQTNQNAESVNSRTAGQILYDQLNAISNTDPVLNNLKRTNKMTTSHCKESLPPYNLNMEPPFNEKKLITSPNMMETNNLNSEHIDDILKKNDTLKKSNVQGHFFFKGDIGQTGIESNKLHNKTNEGEGKTHSCSCVKNKFHSCDHSRNQKLQRDLVNQMIQTDEVKSKVKCSDDDEEEGQEEEIFKTIIMSAQYKQDPITQKKGTDENYKLLSNIIEKVKQNAAEMSSALEIRDKRHDSLQELMPINRKRRNRNFKVQHCENENIFHRHYSEYRARRKLLRTRTLTYGSKLVLSPEIPNDLAEEIQLLENTEEDVAVPKDNPLSTGKHSSIYVNLYKDIIRNSVFLKSLIPPVSSNGLFSDAVECHLNEQKCSLIPWLISLFIPTCECITSKDRHSLE